MTILAILLIAYSAGMLLLHLSSWKLLKNWQRRGRSLSPQVVLRIEALYWLLVLASLPFWPSALLKAVVIAFAAIHLGVWLTGEFRAVRSGGIAALPAKAHRYIVAFDLVEAVALIAIAWFAASYVLHAPRPVPRA